ncbi:hypothetical protein [uncultured Methanoregula sp.]|uniref:hypothetical protein n=1 Tax=uncultured Methanoregula sp. TaxID=1005933 RepID=UPI002AAAE41C|nr:hypothetical protein [uncultured Methanoregula sp.]
MTEKEDWVCLNKLLKSSVPVLTPSFLSNGESREHIDELSRQVEEDYKNYKDGRCGFFKTSVDQEMHARFQMALLVISYCAKKNGQDLQGASASFSDAELEVCELLKKFVMLDNFSATELRQKLIFGDKSTASFFTGYTLLRELTSHLLGHDEIRSPVRQYLKKQGDLYDEKFETAFGSRGGEFIVTASLARQREFDFISRIEHNLKSGRNCITLSGQSFIVDKIEKGDNAGNLSQKTEPVNERRARPADNLPKNQYLMAVFTEKSLVWRKKSVIFYAICVSHAERYREHGFDSKPLELKEIPAYLDPAVIESCKNYPHAFFCIASPTGFENIGIPGSDNRMLNNFISSGVSVCFWIYTTRNNSSMNLIQNPLNWDGSATWKQPTRNC